MRVIIVDDSALIRDGLARLLADENVDVTATFPDSDGVVDAVRDHRPDVLIIDVRMPPDFETEGLETALRARRAVPDTGVLVLSQHIETRYAIELLEEGAAGVGYLLKDRVTQIDDFLDALHRVAAGGSAIDPDVVARAGPPPTHRSDPRPIDGARTSGAVPHGRGALERDDRRATLAQPTDGGDPRVSHPHQTRPSPGRRRRPPGLRGHLLAASGG